MERTTPSRQAIKQLSTTLVLNAQAVVEYLQPGFYEQPPWQLGEAIGKIASGESLHQQTRAQFDLEQKQYQAMLKEVSSGIRAKAPE